MSIARAFVSEHPEVLASHDEWKNETQTFYEQLLAFEQEYGTAVMYTPMNGTFPAQLIGLKITDNNTPPSGWREDTKLGCWVPSKRSKLGKELSAKVANTKCSSISSAVRKFIPVEVVDYTSSRWLSAGCRWIDNRLFITHDEAFKFEGNEYFKRIPLSEYYAAIEAEEKV